jgi:hypothetical protein
MPEVEISYKIEIGTEIPKHLVELARKQGENEDSTCTKLQELKDLFYRKYFLRIFFRKKYYPKNGVDLLSVKQNHGSLVRRHYNSYNGFCFLCVIKIIRETIEIRV